MNPLIFLLIFLTPQIALWYLWTQGDNQKFYRSMGWTHRWIVGDR